MYGGHQIHSAAVFVASYPPVAVELPFFFTAPPPDLLQLLLALGPPDCVYVHFNTREVGRIGSPDHISEARSSVVESKQLQEGLFHMLHCQHLLSQCRASPRAVQSLPLGCG